MSRLFERACAARETAAAAFEVARRRRHEVNASASYTEDDMIDAGFDMVDAGIAWMRADELMDRLKKGQLSGPDYDRVAVTFAALDYDVPSDQPADAE